MTTYTSSDVVDMVSHWNESDSDWSSDENSDYQIDRLDAIQSMDNPDEDEDSDAEDSDIDSDSPATLPQALSFDSNSSQFTKKIGPFTTLHSDATPLDFFTLMFDDNVMDLLVTETNRYAKQNPPGDRYRWYDTSDNELKLFLGMIIAMGIHRLPQLEDYWCSDPLLGVPRIVSGMPIDWFTVLLQCIHANDNTTMKNRDDPDYDRLHKIRPLISMARENFMKEY